MTVVYMQHGNSFKNHNLTSFCLMHGSQLRMAKSCDVKYHTNKAGNFTPAERLRVNRGEMRDASKMHNK